MSVGRALLACSFAIDKLTCDIKQHPTPPTPAPHIDIISVGEHVVLLAARRSDLVSNCTLVLGRSPLIRLMPSVEG